MKRALLLAIILAPFLLMGLAGCTLDTLMQSVVNQPPQAVIDALPVKGPAPLTVRFNAGYSHDDGTIVDYNWSFGDPQNVSPMSTVDASHTYTLPGTYTVKLTVTDNKGEMSSQKVAIVVTNPPPVANFSLSNDAPTIGDDVTFNAAGSYDANGSITSYSWDFGDGATGTGEEVTHSYDTAGYTVVTLTVTDNEGAKTVVRHALNVIAGSSSSSSGGGCSGGSCGGPDIPLAVITGLPSCSGGTTGVAVELDGSYSRAADGKIVSYAWDFGDGTTGTGEMVTHIFKQSGRYIVKLTVTDEAGVKGTAEAALSIGTSCTG
jgi:large repetitive protein